MTAARGIANDPAQGQRRTAKEPEKGRKPPQSPWSSRARPGTQSTSRHARKIGKGPAVSGMRCPKPPALETSGSPLGGGDDRSERTCERSGSRTPQAVVRQTPRRPCSAWRRRRLRMEKSAFGARIFCRRFSVADGSANLFRIHMLSFQETAFRPSAPRTASAVSVKRKYMLPKPPSYQRLPKSSGRRALPGTRRGT